MYTCIHIHIFVQLIFCYHSTETQEIKCICIYTHIVLCRTHRLTFLVHIKMPSRLPNNQHVLNVLLLQCYFRRNGYDFNACNNVRDILYNSDVITSTVQLIIHSSVSKLV